MFVLKSIGTFVNATSISVDGFSNIYVTDANGLRSYSATGELRASAVASGRAHGQFDAPSAVDASLTNEIAVADRGNDRIELYSRDLIWQATIEGHNPGAAIEFGLPEFVASGSSGYFYVYDGERRRLLSINPSTGSQQPIPGSSSTLSLHVQARTIAVDPSEYIALFDDNTSRIVVLNNALSIVALLQYPSSKNIRFSVWEDTLMVLHPDKHLVRLFDVRTLTYLTSYHLPESAGNPVAVTMRDGQLYMLTKEHVYQCSRSRDAAK